MSFSDYIKGYEGENPFSDIQPRSFSDKKIYQEFYPISLYWTLFNDQHEVLLGSRGSGKTFLLKMMRYSMLKKIDHPRAKQLVDDKTFIAMYVPLRVEFLTPIMCSSLSDEDKLVHFQEGFNCLLCEALIVELQSLLDEIEDYSVKADKEIIIVTELEELWFGTSSGISELYELSDRVMKYYSKVRWSSVPQEKEFSVFKKQICFPLILARRMLSRVLELDNEPTWIVCVDEAECLSEMMQKCINTFFRSDSNRVAIKLAALPYYHVTLDTLLEGDIDVSDGNDFNYRVVNLQFDGKDFIGLTNSLCKHRLYDRFSKEHICNSVEEFVGVIGSDDYIDYFKESVGAEAATKENILIGIKKYVSHKRSASSEFYRNAQKALYDRFALSYYLRVVRNMGEHQGNRVPGWYAGAKNIRRVSQGNPRMFIQIMSALFEQAKTRKLTPKVQHKVIFKYAKSICEATKSLGGEGPDAYSNLHIIADTLQKKIHEGCLLPGGNVFTINCNSEDNFKKALPWLKRCIAYSRVIVDEKTIIRGITSKTRFTISNAYAIAYWIPMHSDDCVEIKLLDVPSEDRGEQKISSKRNNRQMTIEEVFDNND